MKRCVLIGGIGSGKSTVSRMLQEHGAACVDLDDCGHEVLLNPTVISMLTETFGEDILDAQGQIDHAALAQKAFATPQATVRLNAITQPRLLRIAQKRLDDLEADGCAIAFVEISAYDGPDGTFAPLFRTDDAVISVTAPKRLRIERAIGKGYSEQDVRNRIARQVSDAQRALWADFVISNKGTLADLQAHVDAIWKKITA
ncbi:dephospho-CoA kinase [Cryptobacterium curtum DSM 15641]|uniref:Dephospho-CoA kinase n=1 Tax=Cryptobacterium curtum (strain ATCC 700683 / DSM 15641 / CCUG 43107 / 12-3) TaxID=469378 RepID=C7MMW2_CRYCD|nr:dephospho-CoA kinase [Cryptobacterium curtum]ACU94252.1 dephospho-CoA kinase [Cryptobacterium curtum DSM 15641]